MKNLIAFHGCDHKVGTTMLSQCVSEYLAESCRNIRVLWMVCSRGGGEDYVTSVGETVEGLRGYLDNRLLNMEEVVQSCRKTDNLYMLGGVRSLIQERYYFPKTAEYLLNCMEQCFDVIIADCGNTIDNGLAVGALSYGGHNVLVTRQSEIALGRMNFIKDIYNQMNLTFSHVVINGFSEERGMFPREITERLDMKDLSYHLICQVDQPLRAEQEKHTLLSGGSRHFRRDIAELSAWTLEVCGLQQKLPEKGLRWKGFI